MRTTHEIIYHSAENMERLENDSVHLMVTSPPYPMIEMWDPLFTRRSPEIGEALAKHHGPRAFELMHKMLDKVWKEVHRVLIPGGIACINIGDATRTINNNFMLYPNHARILNNLKTIGFNNLTSIIWRKQTNAPNKFMGSGMLPPSAYVTLEHEYILILRKGGKRVFKTGAEQELRRASAYFWEERNAWFSDVWLDIKGKGQHLADSAIRKRSAAFRFEVPYRLINMFSIKADTILDPFMGIGTTMNAAMASGRDSVGFEIEAGLHPHVRRQTDQIVTFANQRINERIDNHLAFVKKRIADEKPLKHQNVHYGFPVITRQEVRLLFNPLVSVEQIGTNKFEACYLDHPGRSFFSPTNGADREKTGSSNPGCVKSDSNPTAKTKDR